MLLTGLPDSFPEPSVEFVRRGFNVTALLRTGIPSDDHRWTTDRGSPKNAAIAASPSAFPVEFSLALRVSSHVAAYWQVLVAGGGIEGSAVSISLTIMSRCPIRGL
jgi:hypothetical protein